MPLEARLAKAWPPDRWSDITVLIAVSGGLDSVALLTLVASIAGSGRGRLVAAHFNHGLRGAESDADEQFVRDLAAKLGLGCEVGRAATDLETDGRDGIEAAARSARYEFLQTAAERTGARFVATAHTGDDQAETILHRIIRGTGLSGLAGIRRARALTPVVSLVRPLLEFRRSELREYLVARNQPWREDASNQDAAFTRNRIRHELIPYLQKDFNSGVVESLLRLGTLADESQQIVDRAAAEVFRDSVDALPQGIAIRGARLAEVDSILIREALMQIWSRQDWPLQAMGFEHWDQLRQMAVSEDDVPERHFPGGVRALKTDGQLFLLRANEYTPGTGK